MSYPAPLAQTGDTLIAVYDFTTLNALITYAWNGTPAYTRNPILVDMGYFFDMNNIWPAEEQVSET